MSESLHSGQLPLWNPYINFGLPQYGDLSSGFWSPLTWIIATTVGYNAYTFTLELLCYIVLSGMGMYLLCRSYTIDKKIALATGIAYMCCGYMVGHLQHFNWISGAALLPFCIWRFQLLQKDGSLKNMLSAALLFYLLAASAHPGITIGAIYFFISFAIFLFFKEKKQGLSAKPAYRFIRTNLLLILAIILLASGMIAGYADILPYITRGEKVSEMAALAHPVTMQSWLSALLPLSTMKNDLFFATDLSMRNVYFSLGLLLFFVFALLSKKNALQQYFLFAGLAFLLLSTGGIFKAFAYKYVPLIAYVRLNGEFIIFALCSFILVAALSLDSFFKKAMPFTGKIKAVYYIFEVLIFACIAFGAYRSVFSHNSFLFHLDSIMSEQTLPAKLKALIDNLNFFDALWLQGIIQLFLLWGIKWTLINHKKGTLLRLFTADLILATLLNIPFTGVGKASVADVQQVLTQAPKGIPIPPLHAINANDSIPSASSDLVGNWSFYNKQLGVKAFAFYPIELNTSKQVFADPLATHFQLPCIFIPGDSTQNNVAIKEFTGNSISLEIDNRSGANVVFQQNHYPHWYYITGNKKTAAGAYKGIFLSAALQKGKNNIQFIFEPQRVEAAMLFSAVMILVFLTILALNLIRSSSPS